MAVKYKTTKRLFATLYFLMLITLLLFPIYKNKLDPYELNLAEQTKTERNVFTGTYGYLKIIPATLLASCVYWIIAGIVILTAKQEEGNEQ